MNIFSMAWRNLWRNRRRTLVTIGAIALALTVELLYSGLITGYYRGMERDVLDYEVGDIQVFADGYRDRPSLYTAIDDPDAVLAKLDQSGYAASARLMAGGLAAAGKFSAGVSLRGVDIERESRVSKIPERMGTGEWLNPTDPNGVVIGRRLAHTLEVQVGDELVVLTQGADGSMANDLYTVRGVLMGIADGTDRSAVFMNTAAFRELMVFPKGAHQIVVRRPDTVSLDAAATVVSGAAPDLEVVTWKEIMPVVATMLESTEGMIVIIFLVIYVAVGILILNAMLMAVFERVKEFGLLKALGVSPSRVLAMIFVETAMQTAIAIAIGLCFAIPGMWYLANVGIDVGVLGGMSAMGLAMPPIWYGIYDYETISGPFSMLFVVVFLSVLYPASKAAYLRPVEAMRHQ